MITKVQSADMSRILEAVSALTQAVATVTPRELLDSVPDRGTAMMVAAAYKLIAEDFETMHFGRQPE
jgi:hypothetical protein